jgi:hypothetical protein
MKKNPGKWLHTRRRVIFGTFKQLGGKGEEGYCSN